MTVYLLRDITNDKPIEGAYADEGKAIAAALSASAASTIRDEGSLTIVVIPWDEERGHQAGMADHPRTVIYQGRVYREDKQRQEKTAGLA